MTIQHLYPTTRPSLDLNFARTKRLDPRVTFTRGSTATYVGSDGLIKTAASNTARFDHDPTTGESLGLLVEAAGTNYLLRSGELDDATYWSQNRGATTSLASSILSPDGSSSTAQITESATTGFHYTAANSYNAVTSVPGGTVTVSAWLKAGTRQYGWLGLTNSFGNSYAYVAYDLSNGTVAGSLSTVTPSATTVTPYGNGWYHCRLTANVTNSTSDTFMYIGVSNSDTPGSYSGDITQYIYAWGAQLEQGSFPTSYIPTTSSTVTRSADVASMTGTNFSSWYSQTAGSFIATWDQSVNSSGSLTMIAEGATPYEVSIYTYSGLPQFAMYLSHVHQNNYAQSPSVAIPVNTLQTIGGSYDSSGVTAVLNGDTPVTTGSSIAVNEGATIMHLGARQGGIYHLNGHLARFTYYPTRLTDAQLQALTL